MQFVWIPAALLAGFLQAGRSSVQLRLRSSMTANGAGLVRYAFGLPFAVLLLLIWMQFRQAAIPLPSAVFLGWAAAGGVAQIFGTQMLIEASYARGFVVGTAFSKLEALIAAIVAATLLHERLPLQAWLGIIVGVGGVLAISTDFSKVRSPSLRSIGEPGALLGLGAAAFYALTAVLVKKATMVAGLGDPLGNALLSLTMVMALQTVMQGLWVLWREPSTLLQIWMERGQAMIVGAFSAIGSACWFFGFALAPVALVRLVGTVELVFTVALSHFVLEEPLRAAEIAGLVMIAAGSLAALFAVMG